MKTQKITIPYICKSKNEASPLVCLTAYTTPMAQMLDAHVDIILVGDSVGMVLYGLPSTIPVDMDMMIRHGQAVMRGTKKACVVVDMPFGSYQESKEAAFRNAARIMKETGCDAVKLEGGEEMADTIHYLSSRSIPVMGHIGLQPQSVNSVGGYGVRGKTKDEAKQIIKDAKEIEKAGAFAVVIEGTLESISQEITKAVSIPTIGIGASVSCDGQILVTDDMVGLTQGRKPKFVKSYATLADDLEKAIETYADEVRSRAFPSEEFVYNNTKT